MTTTHHTRGLARELSIASAAWQQILRDRRRPSRLVRRHFDACVFSYLAAELRTGHLAVRGTRNMSPSRRARSSNNSA